MMMMMSMPMMSPMDDQPSMTRGNQKPTKLLSGIVQLEEGGRNTHQDTIL